MEFSRKSAGLMAEDNEFWSFQRFHSDHQVSCNSDIGSRDFYYYFSTYQIFYAVIYYDPASQKKLELSILRQETKTWAGETEERRHT